jgi:hypothetical protein
VLRAMPAAGEEIPDLDVGHLAARRSIGLVPDMNTRPVAVSRARLDPICHRWRCGRAALYSSPYMTLLLYAKHIGAGCAVRHPRRGHRISS